MAWYDFVKDIGGGIKDTLSGGKELLFGSQGSADRNQWRDRDYIGDQARSGIAGAQGRPAPQAGSIQVGDVRQMDNGRSDQFRAQQLGLVGDLRGVASGQMQGAGELAVQRQAQRALGNAAGAATMARGNSAAGGARAAARAAGSIGLGAAGQAQQAALGDQQSARAQMAGILGQGREQDIGIAGANMSAENQRIFQQAGLNQATSLANMQARLQAMGMNDAAIANYLQAIGAMNSSEMGARSQDNGIIGGLISGGAQAYASRK
jgi:hypothetical protein